jgi:hypothetical protein
MCVSSATFGAAQHQLNIGVQGNVYRAPTNRLPLLLLLLLLLLFLLCRCCLTMLA